MAPLLAALAGLLATAPLARAVSPDAVRVESLRGEVRGELIAFDGRRVVVSTPRGESALAFREVLEIEFASAQGSFSPTTERGRVSLRDGTQLVHNDVRIEADGLRLTDSDNPGANIEIPIDAVTAWRRFPPDARAATAWRDLVSSTATADRLLVYSRSGGRVTPAAGAVEQIDAEGVSFLLDGDASPFALPWRRLAGLTLLPPADAEDPQALATLLLRDGSRVVAAQLAWESGGVAWTTPAGASGWTPAARVRSVEPPADRFVPIGSLDYVAAEGASVFDRSFDGDALSLRFPDERFPRGWPELAVTRSFASGVALRAGATLTVRKPPGALALVGWVGLDPTAVDVGDAEVTIADDRTTLWSGRVDGRTAPTRLRLQIAGAETLTLRVAAGDNLDAGDRVHFADLRVLR